MVGKPREFECTEMLKRAIFLLADKFGDHDLQCMVKSEKVRVLISLCSGFT